MRRTIAAAFCALLLTAPTTAETLLVGNKGEDTLSLIALASGEELARLPTGKMPHEVAISPDGKQAAVVAYGSTTIDVFDVASRTEVRTIDLSPNQRPHGLLWLSDGRLVATTEGSDSVAVVAPDGKLTSISTGQKGTHMIVVAPGNRTAYTANIASGTVSVLDLKTAKELRDFAVGGKPEGLSLTKRGNELWIGDLDAPRVQVWDTKKGQEDRRAARRSGRDPRVDESRWKIRRDEQHRRGDDKPVRCRNACAGANDHRVGRAGKGPGNIAVQR